MIFWNFRTHSQDYVGSHPIRAESLTKLLSNILLFRCDYAWMVFILVFCIQSPILSMWFQLYILCILKVFVLFDSWLCINNSVLSSSCKPTGKLVSLYPFYCDDNLLCFPQLSQYLLQFVNEQWSSCVVIQEGTGNHPCHIIWSLEIEVREIKWRESICDFVFQFLCCCECL
jgi:hypothetical protein